MQPLAGEVIHASTDGSLAKLYELCTQQMMHRASQQCSCINNKKYGSFLLTHAGMLEGHAVCHCLQYALSGA